MELTQPALTVDGAAVSTAEVLAAAFLGGRLRALRARLAQDLACQALAVSRDETPDEDEFQESFDSWRVDRDLIAADELERWLAARALELDDVLAHLERRYQARHLASEAASALENHAPEARAVLELLPEEAEISGTMRMLRESHALRAVAPGTASDDTERRARVRKELLALAGLSSVEEGTEFLDVTGVALERARELMASEVDFACLREDLLSGDALAVAARALSSDLVRFDLVTAELSTDDAAREVLCCIRFDRDPFLRSASRAGVAARRQTVFASDTDRLPFGHRLPSARVSELFGPFETEEGHLVAQLAARLEPDPADTDVARRLEQKIIDRSLKRAISERVHFPLDEAVS